MRAKLINSPRVTVIVPVEPEGDPSFCLQALRRLDWPKAKLEVLVVRGRQPSRQRNLATKRAKGEWLLFLDSDSRPRRDLLRRLFEGLAAFGADVAGGPNLPPPDQAILGNIFSAVLASYFGSMSSRARYQSLGISRLSSEKELILCNLSVKRSVFVKLNGFRDDLYPNEENEFLNRLQDAGGQMVYVPEAIVERPRRHSVPAFAKQAFCYGLGRMRQMRANFHVTDLLNLLPLAALAYGLALPFLVHGPPWTLAPLGAYVIAALAASLQIAASSGLAVAWAAFFLFPLRHIAYGMGLVTGIFTAGTVISGPGKISIEKQRR